MSTPFKSFKDFLIESPIIVPPEEFNLSDDEENRKQGAILRADRSCEKIKDLSDGFELYQIKNIFAVFKDTDSNHRIYYLMRYKFSRISMLNNLQVVSQIVLWSDRAIGAFKIAQEVFFNHLLPDNHVIVSDGFQTDDGSRFWSKRVGEALKRNLWVYFIDQTSSPKRMIRIVKPGDLVNLSSEIWGTHKNFERKLLVISDKQLKPKSNVNLED